MTDAPSVDGSVELNWADGSHRFRLPIGQLRELQEKCNAGPMEILNRLILKTWRVDDVRETIRLALIGGGMVPDKALALTIRYVEARPWFENVPIAQAILMAAVIGVPGDQPGKPAPVPSSAIGIGSVSGISTGPALQ